MHNQTLTGKSPVFFARERKGKSRTLSRFFTADTGRRMNSALLACVCLFSGAVGGRADTSSDVDLTQLPLEKLMNLEVTILRGHESLSQTPAAVSVITQED